MNTRVMVVSSCKLSGSTTKRRPNIRFSGAWLNEIGFKTNSLVTIDYEDKNLIFKAHEGHTTYLTLGKLNDKLGLFQVRQSKSKEKSVPCFSVKGLWLEKYGFNIGSVIVACCKHQEISVHVLDVEKLSTDKSLTL